MSSFKRVKPKIMYLCDRLKYMLEIDTIMLDRLYVYFVMKAEMNAMNVKLPYIK